KLETRGRPRPRARVAAHRLPLLAGALPALAAGLWGALALLGLDVPLPRASFARQHGALMALGFLGTLISLERAVALGRPWAYAAPALAGAGGLAAAIGLTLPGKFLLTAAGGWLIAIYVAVLGRRTGRVRARDRPLARRVPDPPERRGAPRTRRRRVPRPPRVRRPPRRGGPRRRGRRRLHRLAGPRVAAHGARHGRPRRLARRPRRRAR